MMAAQKVKTVIFTVYITQCRDTLNIYKYCTAEQLGDFFLLFNFEKNV